MGFRVQGVVVKDTIEIDTGYSSEIRVTIKGYIIHDTIKGCVKV